VADRPHDRDRQPRLADPPGPNSAPSRDGDRNPTNCRPTCSRPTKLSRLAGTPTTTARSSRGASAPGRTSAASARPELAQQRRHVAVHQASRGTQLAGDLGVGPVPRHRREHLALAVPDPVRPTSPTAPSSPAAGRAAISPRSDGSAVDTGRGYE
jgi:hypothetical protein